MTLVFRQQLIISSKDTTGEEYTGFYSCADNVLPALGSRAGFIDAVAAASLSGLTVVAMQQYEPRSGVPATGPYSTARDRMVLMFRSGAGRIAYVHVPAPKQEVFLPNNHDVNLANPLVDAIRTAAGIALSDSSGSNLTTLVKGWRARVEA